MGVEIMVPLIVFASFVLIVVIVVATPLYFRHRNRRVIFDAIKTTIERTGTADPALIAAITQDNIGPNADLRRGVLLLCFAAALAGFGVIVGGDVAAPALGVALFPALIGAAYAVFHFFIPREPTV